MDYFPTYAMPLEMPAAARATIDALHDDAEPCELQAIIDQCVALETDATLADAQGFTRGWVHADGSYQLR